MIVSITFEDMIKYLIVELNLQTGVSKDYIKNVVAVRGSRLAKLLSPTEVTGINLSDTFIIFEVNEDEDTSNNVTINEGNDTVNTIIAYNFYIKIYGNKCHETSQKILARFKSHQVMYKLRGLGIKLNQVTFPTNTNEFINNVMWPRCDMTLKLQVMHNITLTSEEGYIDDENEPIINMSSTNN